MKSIPAATPITLTKEEHAELEGLARSTKAEHRLRQRARIVLLSAAGLATRAIGREVGCTTGTASKWRVRYAERRRPGLDETGDRGNEPKDTDATDKPPGRTRPAHSRGLRALEWAADRQSPRRRRCAICLALLAHPQDRSRRAPPENALVLAVDEKPSIQALERSQGYLKMPNGRALGGHSHDYKRNGTSTLFAAFEVATGKVTAAHKKRRRRIDFLDFMNDMVAAWPDTAIHVVLDNLNTHKPRNDRWLKLHPNVTFHFTPTRASWLNQVEIWFSILQAKSLHGASFTSVKQLREHIDAFIEAYNANARPFVWTKAKVHQRRVKGRRISEL